MAEKEKVLIAYFSWSGNTLELANQIHQFVGGDIFEIQRNIDYPTSYNAVLDVGKQEIRSEDTPELKDKPASIEAYNIIFIGYPNWWNTFPAPVRTFLSAYDFNGKTIVPFCTHGGGGMARSVSNIVQLCPGAKVMDGFSVNGNSVRSNNNGVARWLNGLKVSEDALRVK